jgi:hypothetical protein
MFDKSELEGDQSVKLLSMRGREVDGGDAGVKPSVREVK